LRRASPEVESRCDLLGGLLDGIRHLLQVDLADDVEGEILGHGRILLSVPGIPPAAKERLGPGGQFSTMRVPGGPLMRKSAAGRAFTGLHASNRNSVRFPAESW